MFPYLVRVNGVEQKTGNGVVVDPGFGLIVTAYHLVEPEPKKKEQVEGKDNGTKQKGQEFGKTRGLSRPIAWFLQVVNKLLTTQEAQTLAKIQKGVAVDVEWEGKRHPVDVYIADRLKDRTIDIAFLRLRSGKGWHFLKKFFHRLRRGPKFFFKQVGLVPREEVQCCAYLPGEHQLTPRRGEIIRVETEITIAIDDPIRDPRGCSGGGITIKKDSTEEKLLGVVIGGANTEEGTELYATHHGGFKEELDDLLDSFKKRRNRHYYFGGAVLSVLLLLGAGRLGASRIAAQYEILLGQYDALVRQLHFDEPFSVRFSAVGRRGLQLVVWRASIHVLCSLT